MGLGNVVVLSQCTAFILMFIFSFFIFVPVSINYNEFDGHCLLYATGTWVSNTSKGVQLELVEWGPGSACNFAIFMGVVMMLLSLFYIVMQSAYLIKDMDSSWLEAFLTTIVCVVMTIMMFSATLTLTVGFDKWCSLVTAPESEISSCELADFIKFTEFLGNIDATNFFTEMKMAEFGCWASLVCWVFVTIVSVYKLYRYQQHESFRSSVNRERERLLQKVGQRSDPIL